MSIGINWQGSMSTQCDEASHGLSNTSTNIQVNNFHAKFTFQLSKTCQDKMWRILSIATFVCSCLNLWMVAYRHAHPTTLQCHNIDNHNMSVHHHENIRYFTTYSMEYSIPDRLILPHPVNKLRSFDGTWTVCVCVCVFCTVLQTSDIPVFPGVHLQ